MKDQLNLGVRMLQAQSHMCAHISPRRTLRPDFDSAGRATNSISATHLVYVQSIYITKTCIHSLKQILFDGGKVVDYLKTVKEWLDGNPEEVLTFIFTNPENVSVSEVWKPVFEETGALHRSRH